MYSDIKGIRDCNLQQAKYKSRQYRPMPFTPHTCKSVPSTAAISALRSSFRADSCCCLNLSWSSLMSSEGGGAIKDRDVY